MLRPHLREAASVDSVLHLAKLPLNNMSKMTIFQLGVLVFAICLSTQVVSQNSTDTAGGNSTSHSNMTTMPTDTFSGSASTTASPSGAGLSLHAGTFSFLVPVVVAASLQQRFC